MTEIATYYINSELSFAAYSTLYSGISRNDYIDSLNNAGTGMSSSQAAEFADTWEVLDQYDGTTEESYLDDFGQEHYYINHTGLNVTLFQNTETGEQVVAIRGTEINDISDLLTDVIDIGTLGSTEHQAQYQALTTKVKEWMDTGLLTTGFTVTGHSLGGYLATNLSMEYFSDVTHTYIYNAPGLDGIPDGNIFSAIYNALLPGVPLEIPHNPFISNIIAPDDIINLVGLYPSTPITVSVEPTDALGAHSIVPLTDALAVYSLLSTIGNSNDVDSITPILKAASLKEPPRSLEKIVEGLSGLFVNPVTLFTDDREAFYQAIYAIEVELFEDRTLANPVLKPQYQGLTLTDLSGYTQTDLVNGSSSDIAIRYAIVNLNPFAVSGNDSLYDRHNQSQELDIYNESTREGSLTVRYFEDRANFLYVLNQSGLTDSQYSAKDLILFHDKESDELVTQASTSDHIGQQFTFGTVESDTLTGGSDNDHFYGGAGDDKLTGLGGADYMEGGEGDDTYIADDGDTIFDTDGFGRVVFGDIVLFGGVSSGNSNTYQSRDGKATYKLVDHTLTVTGDAGILTIQNFNNLDLGIVLENAQPAPKIEPIGLMEGNTSTITLNLDHSAGDNGAVYELVVSDPDLLTLSGDGVEVLDAPSGRYRVSVTAGASSLTLQANALANDGNKIVNSVTLNINEVIYTADGQSDTGRQLSQVDLIIDDTHYDPAHAVHDYDPAQNAAEGGRNLVGGDPEGVLTYSYGRDDSEVVVNAGELTRTYGGGGADDFDSTYNYDMFDGSTLEEIAQYYIDNIQPAATHEAAMQWATDNRALRDAGNFNDWSDGGAGNDYMFGGDGEDYLDGGADNDYLNGGGGDDILIAGEGAENLLNGYGQNDLLIGGSGVDYLFGDASVLPVERYPSGDEWSVTREGNEIVFNNCTLSFGWTGRDFDGDDRIYAGAGNDYVIAGGGADFVDGGIDDDYIEGNGGGDTLFGGNGADTIRGAGGEQSAYSMDGDDYIDGGAGNDTITGDGGSDTIYGGSGDDTIFGNGDTDNLYGTEDGGDFLYGEAGNDTISGNEGNDRVDGGAGEDHLFGDSGNDTLLGGSENDTLSGGDDDDLLYGGVGDDHLQGDDGADILHGGDDSDTLYGGNGDDSLYGDAGVDFLYGEAGDDMLDGGEGADQLIGGAGNDTLLASAADDYLDGGAGDDTYVMTVGSGHDVIADTAGSNRLRFGEGIARGDVWSTHTVSPDGKLYQALVYSATDTLYFQPAFSDNAATAEFSDDTSVTMVDLVRQVKGEFKEDLSLDGQLQGTQSDDMLLGREGNDMISGGAGDDWLDGGADDDVVSGGSGDDALLGGAGTDQLFGDGGDDYLDGGSGGDVLSGGTGNDTYAFTAQSDDLVIVEPETDGGNDRLIMHDGLTPGDITPWRSGDDLILSVKGGEQEITIKDQFATQEGCIDEIRFSDGTVWNQDYFTAELLQQGIDHLTGTAGDDTYQVDRTGDSIDELSDAGVDTVISSVRYTLPDNVENLTLTGSGDLYAIGNGLDNVITGNDGDNALDGAGAQTSGGDKLIGGMGNDTYIVRDMNEVEIVEQSDEGVDTIICRDTQGCALPDNVENIEMSLSGSLYTGQIALAGNDLNNVIKGDMTLSNHIDGGAGADEMWGGRNNDYYVLDDPGDTVFDFGGQDWVSILPGYTMDDAYTIAGTQFESVEIAAGSKIKTLSGNESANWLYYADMAYGYGGNDTIFANVEAHGGEGGDTLYAPLMYGDEGDDELHGAVAYGGKGNDTIYNATTVHYQLGDGADWIDDPARVVFDGGISMHDVDIEAVTRVGWSHKDIVIHLPDGGQLTLNGNAMNNAWSAIYCELEFAQDGRIIHKVQEIQTFVRDVKTVGTANADDMALTGLSNLAYGLEGDDHIKGSNEWHADNTLLGGAGNDELIAGAWDGDHIGENWLYGDEGNDLLTAGTGYNYLYGGTGDDRLIAGNGRSSQLYGGEGSDEYRVSKDASAVSIRDDAGEQDCLIFGEGIVIDTLGVAIAGNTIVITDADGPKVTVGDMNSIEAYVFSDGTTLTSADFIPMDGRLMRLARGSAENHSLDVAKILGQNSSQPSRFIEIGLGVAQQDLDIQRIGSDLVLHIQGETANLTITNWFLGEDDSHKVPRLVFMDGGEMDLAAIESRVVYLGSDGDDLLQDYRGQDDTIQAGAGDDTLNGGAGNDVLYGEAGSDTINGGAGNDLISGGAGNDILNGGTGDDTFLVFDGDGQDVIDTRDGGTDVISLGAGLSLDRLSFSQDGLDLLILVDEGSAQSLRVSDHFAGTGGGIDSIVADDGSSISAADIAALLPGTPPSDDGIVIDNEITGDAADNQLLGTNGNDLIDGAGGADTLFGFAGDDRLLGGEGDDYLSGGNGSNDPNDGNDHLIGGIGNDTLFGEGGNDLMEGGLGDDHYYYKAGGGQDSIDASGGGVDGLFFLDVARDRLSFHQDGNDLVIRVDGDAGQQVRVLEHFTDAAHAIAYVQPDGGYSISGSEIVSLLTPMTSGGDSGGDTTPPDTSGNGSTPIKVPDPSLYDQVITGTAAGEQLVGGSGADYLDALAGDDQLFGLSGNDALLGGDGADYLDGGAGDDIQLGGAGNDQLGGDAGNDGLRGGLGDDIYVYRPGSGADVIDNSDGGVDWLIFTDNLTADRLSYWRSGDDLIVRVDDDATQQVTVQGWYAGNSLSYIQPAGGYGISASQIESMASDLTAAGRALSMAGSDLQADMGMLDVMSDAIGKIAISWMESSRFLKQKPAGNSSILPDAEATEIKADYVSANSRPGPIVISPPGRIERMPVAEIPSSDLCIKPIVTSDKSIDMPSQAYESKAGIANLQIEQLIQSMAAFGKPGVHDLLFSRHEDRTSEVTLSVSSMN